MIKFMNKNKGSISVFMVMILLPVMVLGSILIDQTRRKLAEARVAQATDLTLNTALATYDNILKEVYGIFATSQSTDEMFNNLEDYYTRNLMVAGFDEVSAGYLSDNIISQVQGLMSSEEDVSSYADFLSTDIIKFTTNIDLANNTNSKKGPTLANPGLLREQVVDFMKFRAPLGIGLEIIDLIKSFDTVEEQTQVIENKTAYYEAKSDMEENLSKAWAELEKYQKLTQGNATMPTDASTTSYSNNWENFYAYNGPGKDTVAKYYKLDSITLNSFKSMLDIDKADGFKKMFDGDISNAIIYEQLMAEPELNNNIDQLIKTNYKLFSNIGKREFEIKNSKGEPQLEPKNKDELDDGEYFDYVYNYDYWANDTHHDFVTIPYPSSRAKNKVSSTTLTAEEIDNKKEEYRKVLKAYNDNYTNFKKIIEQTSDAYPISLENVSRYNISDCNKDALVSYMIGAGDWASAFTAYTKSLFNLINAYYDNPDSVAPSAKDNPNDPDRIDLDGDYEYGIIVHYIDNFLLVQRLNALFVDAYNDSNLRKASSDSSKAWSKIYNQIFPMFRGIVSALNNGAVYLTRAEKYLDAAISCYDDNVAPKKEIWSKSTDNGKLKGSNFANTNKQEIQDADEAYTRQDIVDLKDRVNKVKINCQNLTHALYEIKFCGYNLFDGVMNNLTGYVNVYQNVVKAKFGANYGHKFLKHDFPTDAQNGYLSFTWFDQQVELDDKAGNYKFEYNGPADLEFGSNTPKLYKYMAKMFKGASDLDANKDKKTNTKSDEQTKEEKGSDDLKDNNKNLSEAKVENVPSASAGYSKKMDGIDSSYPSNASSENLFTINEGSATIGKNSGDDWKSSKDSVKGIGGAITGVFGKILEELKKGVENFRNYIYIEEYIMGMFSYKTMEKEAFIKLYEDQIGEGLGSKLLYSDYHIYNSEGSEDSTNYTGAAIDGYETSAVKEKIETLTNIAINPTNNVAYLNEVEYIIFGSKGSSSVNNTIKLIRFALNTVSAFTNSELTSIAQSIALACFGFPPLTFLVPIAQIAILIAIAIGETALDMQLINGGFSVPVFKTQDTWMLSPSGLVSETTTMLKETAKKEVKKLANEVTDWATEQLYDAAGKLTEEGKKLIGKAKEDITSTMNDAYDDSIGIYVDDVTGTLLNMCDTYLKVSAAELGMDQGNDYDAIAQKVIDNIENVVNYKDLDHSGLEYIIKSKTVQLIKANKGKIVELVEAADQTVTNKAQEVTDRIKNIPIQIKETIMGTATAPLDGLADWGSNKIDELKDAAVSKVTDAMQEGKDAFLDASDKFFDGLADKCTGVDGGELSSTKAKAISLGYSGYIRIFLMISLVSGEEAVLLRMADVIQKNMRSRSVSSFAMSKAYTVVTIETENEIKPLFFNFDGIEKILGIGKYSNDPSKALGFSISDLYKINYKQSAGY